MTATPPTPVRKPSRTLFSLSKSGMIFATLIRVGQFGGPAGLVGAAGKGGVEGTVGDVAGAPSGPSIAIMRNPSVSIDISVFGPISTIRLPIARTVCASRKALLKTPSRRSLCD